ncbi:hypothetical protein PROFUN_02833 [Planoprotostelium fungivorum]|uniref:Uncharacterized protein n=1 Tax=Planoprotostelium fungivorum TaxID=1890364 RepID=A0A2P6NXP5_9EUKA|nr:hypothetical protein PROFUN_09226 [Planoprotostelium fungivorum]PRP88737.1 hypothetical protein PROFUN_02833 [Planoprotostelium fungivorum]
MSKGHKKDLKDEARYLLGRQESGQYNEDEELTQRPWFFRQMWFVLAVCLVLLSTSAAAITYMVVTRTTNKWDEGVGIPPSEAPT